MPESGGELPITIGWDIGGAHLKAARLDAAGRLRQVVQLPCPLWLGMDRLEAACDTVLAALPDQAAVHAVTMTGEMADLFPDRASGVVAIVALLRDRLAQRRPDDRLRIFAGGAGFVAADEVRADPGGNTESIASANWLATALRCAAGLDQGLLVDIGSTTTDLIPFAAGRVLAVGASDRARLAEGELVYAGIIRTPLMALAGRAPFAGAWRTTMAEHFATTADVFRVLGELDEASDAQPAADGGAKTGEASARRLLRMVGEDLADCDASAVGNLARWYRQRLLEQIGAGLAQGLSRGDLAAGAALIGAGVGRFLVAELAARCGRPYQGVDDLLCADLADPGDPQLRAQAGHCAPAVAVAQLSWRSRQ